MSMNAPNIRVTRKTPQERPSTQANQQPSANPLPDHLRPSNNLHWMPIQLF
jgi:hypothetical protein